MRASQRLYRRLGALSLVSLACAALGPSCAVLDEIEGRVCGNQVLDPGEDCDEDSLACGAPGTEHACRWVCSGAGAPTTCPVGYQCGANGVCATPGDSLVFGREIPRGGDAVAVRDFDLDSVADVAIAADATRTLDVLFLSPDLTVEVDRTVPISTAQLASGQVGVDDFSDIVLSSEAALVSLSTPLADRNVVGEAFALPVDIPAGSVGRALALPARAVKIEGPEPVDLLEADASVEGLLLTAGPEGGTALFMRDPYTGATVPVALLTQITSMDDVVGMVRAPFVPRIGAECDEVAIVRRDSPPTATILLLCDEAGEPSGSSDACDQEGCQIDIPLGSVPPQSAFALQLDLDPELELVVLYGEPGGPPERIDVIERIGPYAFDRRATTFDEAWIEALEDVAGAEAAPVLNVADIDADGAPDFVRSDGVYLSKPEEPFSGLTPSYYRAATPSVGAWSEAALGDFDGDGRLDVVGVTDDPDADLDLESNVGLSYFNPRSVPARGRTGALVVADLDGDGAQDLVVRERAEENDGELPLCEALDDIVVRFGEQGGLTPGRVIARLAGVEQMTEGRLPRLDKRDSVDDFGVLSRCAPEEGTDPELRIAVFYGATNRQIAAPFTLVDQFDDLEPDPDALVPYVPGAFAVSERQRVTAAMGQRPAAFNPPGANVRDLVLFALETEDGTFDVPHLVPLPEASHMGIVAAETRVAFADLEGDGQEAILVADPMHLHVIRDFRQYPGKTEELGALEDDIEEIPLDLADVHVDELAAFDLDGDGAEEVFVVGSSADGPLFRYYELRGGDAVAHDVAVDGEGRVLGIAFMPRPASPELEVVIALEGFGAIGYRLAGGELEPSGFSAPAGEITTLDVGDVDGDRFTDVVIVEQDRSLVYLRAVRYAGDDPSDTDDEEAQ